MIVHAVVAAALAVSGPVPAPQPEDPLEKACPGGICAIPTWKLQQLLDAHNAHVLEIRDLNRAIRAAEVVCRTHGA